MIATSHDPERCGQDRGYYAHRRRGENPCVSCCDAHNEVNRAYYCRPRTVRVLAPCGTVAAYRRHLRNGQKACTACVAAQTTYTRAYTYAVAS